MEATRLSSVSHEVVRLSKLPPHAIIADTSLDGRLADLAGYAHYIRRNQSKYPNQYFDLIWSEPIYPEKVKLGGHFVCDTPESGCTQYVRQSYMVCGLQIIEQSLPSGIILAMRVF